MEVESLLEELHSGLEERFRQADRVRSYHQFLEDFAGNPGLYLRNAPQYVLDMVDYFGTREALRVGQEAVRRRVFDRGFDSGESLLVGQERVQESLYQNLQACAKRGKADKMFLLHGPNGSGKTTIVECLMAGLEHYSRTDEGVLLKFNWIFTEREGKLDRIGFESEDVEAAGDQDTYAYLEERDISAKLGCELRDSPIFLIPQEVRQQFIERVLADAGDERQPRFCYDYYLQGDLCQKCKKIYDTLLLAYQGDWRKVLRHIQVERFYISRRYRTGAVSIEPQGNVDAASRPVQHENAWNIPSVLRNVSLSEPVGDIVDANRGILEYSDFLKRSLEVNKYLLTTCERGTVSLGSSLAYLDVLIVGTSNEKQLNLFKRNPDFSSFKGRIELISVPYLLRYSTEAELYGKHLALYSRERHVTPHAATTAALWAVLTRLRRPISKNYSGALQSAAGKLSPMEKAKLYDSGEVPSRFSEEERKLLRSNVLTVRQEFEEDEGEFEGLYGAEYEGRRGASPREMMTILARAAEMRRYKCLTPMAIFDALEELLKDVSLYDYLRLPADGEYHDVSQFLSDVKLEYYGWVTSEVYGSFELIDEGEYDRVFLEYFRHVKASHTGEKVYNAGTNSYEEPNTELMDSIENLIDTGESTEEFRSQVITRIAAWSLDHPQKEINYQELFAEIYRSMRSNFYRERNRLLTLIEQDVLKYGTDEFELLSSQEQEQVHRALGNMKSKYGYCENCARDVIAYVLRCRSEMEMKLEGQ